MSGQKENGTVVDTLATITRTVVVGRAQLVAPAHEAGLLRGRPPARRSPDSSRTLLGILLAAGAAAAMGSSAPALKAMASSGFSVVNISQLRATVGAAVLLAVAMSLGKRLRIARTDWWLVAWYGAWCLGVNQVVFMMTLKRLPVGVAQLLESLAPLLVAGWVLVVRRTAVHWLVWVGIGSALLGLALVGRVWSGFALDATGVVFGLLSAMTLAGRFLLAERGVRSYDPLVLAAWERRPPLRC